MLDTGGDRSVTMSPPHRDRSVTMSPPHRDRSVTMSPPHRDRSVTMSPPHRDHSVTMSPPHRDRSVTMSPPHRDHSVTMSPPHRDRSVTMSPPHRDRSVTMSPPHRDRSVTMSPPHRDRSVTMSPPHRDRVWLLAAVLLLYSGGALSHHVSVPPGPLYRTEGSTLSLWCNTSSPSVAAYEWSMFPAHSPGRKLQIVSSADPGFSYAVFRDRVLDRRIYLERATEASTRLHMLRLQKEDAGEYECYAPSPTLRYYRSYCASVTLTVIPDSLHVSLLSPQELTLYTDDPLTLSCEVFSRTEQHTHFSVSWYRQDSAQPLLTLSELSVVSAGSPYKKRHQAGEIRLEKVSAILYHLIVSSLEPDDQAKYYCQATEWIQDPDKTWYPLTTKRSHGTRVHVVSPRSALLGGAADVMSAVRSQGKSRTDAPPCILRLLLPLVMWTMHYTT